MSYYYKHIGTSLAYVLSEIAVLIVSVYFLSMTKIEFISLSQLKKVTLYTGILLSVVLLTTLVNNLLAGVIVTAVVTLITAYRLFRHEYFLMEGKTNV